MPFFWVGGFGGGVLSALLAGATLVTEPTPQPESTLRLLERERVTLFRGWPDQAETLARQADSVGADLSALRPGSLEALLPADLRAAPGARAKLFGMTESFGPYCGYAADTDMPPSAWGSCGKPFDGHGGSRSSTSTPDSPSTPARSARFNCAGPTRCAASAAAAGRSCSPSTATTPPATWVTSTPTDSCSTTAESDDMFKVSGATVYPSEVEAALRTLDGVRRRLRHQRARRQRGPGGCGRGVRHRLHRRSSCGPPRERR